MIKPQAVGSRVSDLLALDRPLVVATFTDSQALPAGNPDGTDSDAVLAGLTQMQAAGMDIAEIRVDRMGHQDGDLILAELGRFATVPTIATNRWAEEQGEWRGSEADRLGLFGALVSEVDAIDIELGASEILGTVAEIVKSADRTLIVSSHHFSRTPSTTELENMLSSAKGAEADLFKLAAWANDESDLRRLARFTLDHAASGLVVIAMGPLGAISRVFFPALGSRLTYASVDHNTVPGQLTLAETAGQLRRYYPAYVR